LAGEEEEEEEASFPAKEAAMASDDLDVRRNETEEDLNGKGPPPPPPPPPRVRPTVPETLPTAKTFIAFSTLLLFSNQFNSFQLYPLSFLIQSTQTISN